MTAYWRVPSADFDGDSDVDGEDRQDFAACITGPSIGLVPGCEDHDLDRDGDVDQNDYGIFQRCLSGENHAATLSCAD